MVPRPAAFTWPGSLLEMPVIGAHPRPTESEILGLVTSNNKPCLTRWFWHKLKFKKTCFLVGAAKHYLELFGFSELLKIQRKTDLGTKNVAAAY